MTVKEQAGERRTRQREAILEAIKASEGPLSISAIHQASRKRIKGLGIATVYRNVNLLSEKGEIRPVLLPSGDTCYESAGLSEHHHHFLCESCKKAFDLHFCPLENLPRAHLPKGFKVSRHELTFLGLCSRCA